MRNIWNIFLKEIKLYFNSPIAYIVIVVWLLISGWFFSSTIFLINQVTIDNFLNNLPLFFVFFIPAITMKLFAEELKSGTIEVLTTLPVKDYEIITGKFLASFFVVTIAILMTLIHPFTLLFLGKLDFGQVIGSYLGIWLMGFFFTWIGCFSSSLTKNQIIAFIIGFVICFTFFMIGKTLDFVPARFVTFVEYVSIDYHFENISKGVIDSRDIIYYFSFSAFFYFLTLYSMGSRKWK